MVEQENERGKRVRDSEIKTGEKNRRGKGATQKERETHKRLKKTE